MTVSRMRRVAAASLAVTASMIAGATLVACERAAPVTRADTTSTSAQRAPVANAQSVARATPHDSAPAPTLADTVDPAATLRVYLARARMHRATRDTLVWEPGADSTSGFRAFADSTIATFTVGTAGRIDAAAGSRYVTVPVDVDVAAPGATPVTLHGTATLRRAVVDGATDAERRWRIMRIEWSAPR